jgi:UDP-N-acetylmuramate--alanine ligase
VAVTQNCRAQFAKRIAPPSVAALRARGHRRVATLDDAQQLSGLIKDIARPGDYVVLLGAGNITQWAYALPGELKALG